MAGDLVQHNRRSIRLKGCDYTQAGAYFVTLCARDKACIFGAVVDGGTRLNEYGREVADCWLWLAEQYPYVVLDEWVVMPNHLHGIIVITDGNGRAGGSDVAERRRGGSDGGRGGSRTAPTGSRNNPTGPHDAPMGPRNNPTGSHDAPMGSRDNPTGPHDAPMEPRNNPTGPHGPPMGPRNNLTGSHGPPMGSRDVAMGFVGPPTAPASKRKPLGRLIGAFKTVSTRRVNDIRSTSGAKLWQRNYYEHVIRDDSSLQRIREYIANNPARWGLDREREGASSKGGSSKGASRSAPTPRDQP